MTRARRSATAAVLVAGLVAVLFGGASCSGDGAGSAASSTLDPFVPSECNAADPELLIDQIDEAIAAVEADLGGEQEYYEINATTAVVNLFVAGNAGEVTPFAFAGGALSSEQAETGATGNTFAAAAALAFDPMRVSSCVAAELPTSVAEAFIVLGGPDGTVGYSVLTRSSAGGQLMVEVGADGAILGVDPL